MANKMYKFQSYLDGKSLTQINFADIRLLDVDIHYSVSF